MDLLENIREGLRSVKANLLRSVLTALIVAIGITSLVGILTAIDGIEASVNESLASLGVNTFDIRSKANRDGNRGGVTEKVYPSLKMNEAFRFIDQFKLNSTISLSAQITQIAEVKHLSKKTNPNVFVNGINDDYLSIKALEVERGRNFSRTETQRGSPVVILGYKVFTTLYDANESPIGTEVTFSGVQFRVVGVLKEKGQLADNNYDNMVFIPVIKGNQMAKGNGLDYELVVGINDPSQMEYAMGEATGVMRSIRRDRPGHPNSFELEKSETLAQNMEAITTGLRFGGFGIGFVTLLGASIALMNIMLVSVTERTREVGVRKALGATPKRIRQQFLIEAIVVCLLGGLTGVVLGIAVGNVMARALSITVFVMPWMWIVVGLGVCVFVGIISGYYPAKKASRLDPIESLRFE